MENKLTEIPEMIPKAEVVRLLGRSLTWINDRMADGTFLYFKDNAGNRRSRVYFSKQSILEYLNRIKVQKNAIAD